MKKIIAFLSVIIVLFIAIYALTVYQQNTKLANNPYPKDDLHPGNDQNISMIQLPNLIMPDELAASFRKWWDRNDLLFQPVVPVLPGSNSNHCSPG